MQRHTKHCILCWDACNDATSSSPALFAVNCVSVCTKWWLLRQNNVWWASLVFALSLARFLRIFNEMLKFVGEIFCFFCLLLVFLASADSMCIGDCAVCLRLCVLATIMQSGCILRSVQSTFWLAIIGKCIAAERSSVHKDLYVQTLCEREALRSHWKHKASTQAHNWRAIHKSWIWLRPANLRFYCCCCCRHLNSFFPIRFDSMQCDSVSYVHLCEWAAFEDVCVYALAVSCIEIDWYSIDSKLQLN